MACVQRYDRRDTTLSEKLACAGGRERPSTRPAPAASPLRTSGGFRWQPGMDPPAQIPARNSSTESAPVYCFSASFSMMRTTGAMPSPGISRAVVVDQLAWRIEQILKMRMGEFTRLEQVEIFEPAQARPEMEEVEHRLDTGMCRLSNHLERRGQRCQVGRRSYEFDHRRQVVLPSDFSWFRGCSLESPQSLLRSLSGWLSMGSRSSASQGSQTDRNAFSTSPATPPVPDLGSRYPAGPRQRTPVSVPGRSERASRRATCHFSRNPSSKLSLSSDVLDPRLRPAFKRPEVSGRPRCVLVDAEQHLAGNSRLRVDHPGQGSHQGSQ